jgi:hypothetical protein
MCTNNHTTVDTLPNTSAANGPNPRAARSGEAMTKLLFPSLFVLVGCAQSDTLVDAGAVCIDGIPDDGFPNEADVAVGEPIPLSFTVSAGCSASLVDAECMVDVVDGSALISTVVTVETPGRLPWASQNDCAVVLTTPCDMPPAPEGVTTIHYGENQMSVFVPGLADGCIGSQSATM